MAFHHIPKTGGTSVIKWLRKHYPNNWDTYNHDIKKLKKVPDAELYTGHELNLLFDTIKPNFTTTIIRQPVALVNSLYNYHKQIGLTNDSFYNWLDNNPYYTSLYTILGGVAGLRNQFNLIGTFEALDTYTLKLSKALGIPYEPLPYTNKQPPYKVIDISGRLQQEIEIYDALSSLQ